MIERSDARSGHARKRQVQFALRREVAGFNDEVEVGTQVARVERCHLVVFHRPREDD